ncbi:hypothetical protein ACLB1M_28970 [Escherichia coli]
MRWTNDLTPEQTQAGLNKIAKGDMQHADITESDRRMDIRMV